MHKAVIHSPADVAHPGQGGSWAVGNRRFCHLLRAANILYRASSSLMHLSSFALPAHIKAELYRENERHELVNQQLKDIELAKEEAFKANDKTSHQVEKLKKLKGIGPVSSWDLVCEFFGWRDFKNVKQVGAAAGLTPTPYSSGDSQIEQGISKSGNRRVRKVMIEVGWYWLRYQEQSELSQWFTKRFALGGKRMRRIGIVALSRKLLIALWKYLEKGIVPEGAILKA